MSDCDVSISTDRVYKYIDVIQSITSLVFLKGVLKDYVQRSILSSFNFNRVYVSILKVTSKLFEGNHSPTFYFDLNYLKDGKN